VVLDRCGHWVNLTPEITAGRLAETRLVDLSPANMKSN